MDNLKQKTAKGIGWSFADNVSATGVTAIVSIVLARILSPDEFGLIGMTTLFMSLANIFTESGFCVTLTRKKDADNTDFNTIFYTNVALSVIFYFVLFFCARPISLFFKAAELVPIIRILGLSLIFSALGMVHRVILVRKIDFKTQTIISLSAALLSGGIGIYMALSGYGVWSLVFQQLSKAVFSALLLWIFSSWKPALLFSMGRLRQMFRFSSRLLAASFITVIWNEVYSLIIGRIYNAAVLGQYTRAEKFKGMITSNVSIVMQRVSYPVLSTIQDEHERQARAFRKMMKTSALITFTCVLGLAAVAKPLVLVLIGEKWLPSVHFLQILCFSGLFIPLLSNCISVINVNGRSGLTLRLEIIKTLLAVGPVLLGIYYSIDWMLWGLVATSFISYLLHSYYVSKVTDYGFVRQLLDLLPALIIAAIMAAAVWSISLISLPQFVLLALQLVVGILLILLIYEKIYSSEEYFEIKEAIQKLFKK